MNDVESLKTEMKAMHDLEDITKMLEQVAAREIARMRSDILESRRFFKEVWAIYRALKELTPPPPQVIRKHLVVAVGLDWGMPGDLLARMLRRASQVQATHGADMLLAGNKCHHRYRGNGDHTVHRFSIPRSSSLKDIQPIYKMVAQYAHVTFVYPKFVTLSRQMIETSSFDVSETGSTGTGQAVETVMAKRYVVYPDPQTVADYLNEAVVGITVYHYFAEAMLSYSAAQMVAMRNGNNNAIDAATDLRERYHRERRAVIDSKIRELYGSRFASSRKGGS